MNEQRNVAVIGGGISGLAAAYELSCHIPKANITLFEKTDRPGGILQTEYINDCLVETSADMFLSKPDTAVQLCEELGIGDQLIEPEHDHRRSWIGLEGNIYPIPEGFSVVSPTRLDSIVKTKLLTPYGKLRLLAEIAIPPGDLERDISLAEFAISRFGREAFDRLIQPLVAGIYTADPEKLSIQATMPQILEKLKIHGSLIKAGQVEGHDKKQREASGARYGLFRTLRNGIKQLIDSLTEKLSGINLELNTAVESLSPTNKGWSIGADRESQQQEFESVILTCPTYVSAGLVRGFDAELANELDGIEYASAAIVVVAAPRENFQKPLEGFGLVLPSVDQRPVIALSCTNRKFAGRAPAGMDVYRVFIGGALQSEMVDYDDQKLQQIAVDELTHWLGFDGRYEFVNVFRWRNAMPQYHLGHRHRVNSILERIGQHRGLQMAGNVFDGVGIPACIRFARSVARDARAT